MNSVVATQRMTIGELSGAFDQSVSHIDNKISIPFAIEISNYSIVIGCNQNSFSAPPRKSSSPFDVRD
jgi:hypothetical protein